MNVHTQIAKKIKSQRIYGVGMSFKHCYTEWTQGRDTHAGFYRWACHWLMVERFCMGLFR